MNLIQNMDAELPLWSHSHFQGEGLSFPGELNLKKENKKDRKRFCPVNLFACTESRPFHLFISSLKADARKELRLAADM